MKTWEMIKKLTENSSKEFKREDGLVLSTSIDDTLIWEPGYTHLNLHDEWEEVKEPVSFMEAVESGKRIRHELWLEYDFLEVVLYKLSELSTKTMRDMILGKWYIE